MKERYYKTQDTNQRCIPLKSVRKYQAWTVGNGVILHFLILNHLIPEKSQDVVSLAALEGTLWVALLELLMDACVLIHLLKQKGCHLQNTGFIFSINISESLMFSTTLIKTKASLFVFQWLIHDRKSIFHHVHSVPLPVSTINFLREDELVSQPLVLLSLTGSLQCFGMLCYFSQWGNRDFCGPLCTYDCKAFDILHWRPETLIRLVLFCTWDSIHYLSLLFPVLLVNWKIQDYKLLPSHNWECLPTNIFQII